METSTLETSHAETGSKRTPFVFEIREENFPKLAERFAKMVKRARKNHLAAPTFEIIHEQEEQVLGLGWNGEKEVDDSIWRKYIYVAVEGERPRIDGWDFVATIDHTEEMNIIRTVPGMGNMPVEYRKSAPVCQHCNTARRRNETFIIRNRDGETKQIGRNCLQDFFPGASPADVAQMLEWYTTAVEMASTADDEDGYGGGGGGQFRYGLATVVTLGAKVIDTMGWVSRKEAQDSWGKTATADWVAQLCRKPEKSDSEELKRLRETKTTDDHRARAESAIEWARNIDPDTDSDYLYNLHAICKGESVNHKSLGFAVSVLATHKRELDAVRARETAATSESSHVGTVGERDIFRALTLEHIGEPRESDWGVSTLLSFRDPAGNLVKWFMSDRPRGNEWMVGTAYDLVATPKNHGEFRGQKETVVNRAAKWDGKWKKPKAKKAK